MRYIWRMRGVTHECFYGKTYLGSVNKTTTISHLPFTAVCGGRIMGHFETLEDAKREVEGRTRPITTKGLPLFEEES